MRPPSRVLVVDDKEAARESLQLLLFGFDCVFSEAENGAKALELIRTNEFDVIFLDLKLPDLPGIEVLRLARKMASSDLGKVIIVTALPDSQTQEEAIELGVFRYLTKPLDYEEIRRVFAEATSELPQSPSPTPAMEVSPPSFGSQEHRTGFGTRTSLPRLLVLDDSEAWLDIMQEVLENDFDLSLTTDANEACKWAEDETFALAILDMKLPGGISGLDVLNRMRMASPDLRAIILTAYPDYGSALESGKRGAIAYVSKHELATLTETVKRILDEKVRPIRVFISYSKRDVEQVSELYEKLTSRGFLPWMDVKNLLPGTRWEPEIRKAIDQADYFIFCLSNFSLFREGIIRKELRQALERQKGLLDDSIFFIAARLEKCKVVEPFNEFQYVDLFKEDGFTRLLQALSSDRKAGQ